MQILDESRLRKTKTFGRPLRSVNPVLNVKSLSPDENPVSLIVLSTSQAYAYAHIKSIAGFLFASCAAKLPMAKTQMIDQCLSCDA